jgi:hypothetical protein
LKNKLVKLKDQNPANKEAYDRYLDLIKDVERHRGKLKEELNKIKKLSEKTDSEALSKVEKELSNISKKLQSGSIDIKEAERLQKQAEEELKKIASDIEKEIAKEELKHIAEDELKAVAEAEQKAILEAEQKALQEEAQKSEKKEEKPAKTQGIETVRVTPEEFKKMQEEANRIMLEEAKALEKGILESEANTTLEDILKEEEKALAKEASASIENEIAKESEKSLQLEISENEQNFQLQQSSTEEETIEAIKNKEESPEVPPSSDVKEIREAEEVESESNVKASISAQKDLDSATKQSEKELVTQSDPEIKLKETEPAEEEHAKSEEADINPNNIRSASNLSYYIFQKTGKFINPLFISDIAIRSKNKADFGVLFKELIQKHGLDIKVLSKATGGSLPTILQRVWVRSKDKIFVNKFYYDIDSNYIALNPTHTPDGKRINNIEYKSFLEDDIKELKDKIGFSILYLDDFYKNDKPASLSTSVKSMLLAGKDIYLFTSPSDKVTRIYFQIPQRLLNMKMEDLKKFFEDNGLEVYDKMESYEDFEKRLNDFTSTLLGEIKDESIKNEILKINPIRLYKGIFILNTIRLNHSKQIGYNFKNSDYIKRFQVLASRGVRLRGKKFKAKVIKEFKYFAYKETPNGFESKYINPEEVEKYKNEGWNVKEVNDGITYVSKQMMKEISKYMLEDFKIAKPVGRFKNHKGELVLMKTSFQLMPEWMEKKAKEEGVEFYILESADKGKTEKNEIGNKNGIFEVDGNDIVIKFTENKGEDSVTFTRAIPFLMEKDDAAKILSKYVDRIKNFEDMFSILRSNSYLANYLWKKIFRGSDDYSASIYNLVRSGAGMHPMVIGLGNVSTNLKEQIKNALYNENLFKLKNKGTLSYLRPDHDGKLNHGEAIVPKSWKDKMKKAEDGNYYIMVNRIPTPRLDNLRLLKVVGFHDYGNSVMMNSAETILYQESDYDIDEVMVQFEWDKDLEEIVKNNSHLFGSINLEEIAKKVKKEENVYNYFDLNNIISRLEIAKTAVGEIQNLVFSYSLAKSNNLVIAYRKRGDQRIITFHKKGDKFDLSDVIAVFVPRKSMKHIQRISAKYLQAAVDAGKYDVLSSPELNYRMDRLFFQLFDTYNAKKEKIELPFETDEEMLNAFRTIYKKGYDQTKLKSGLKTFRSPFAYWRALFVNTSSTGLKRYNDFVDFLIAQYNSKMKVGLNKVIGNHPFEKMYMQMSPFQLEILDKERVAHLPKADLKKLISTKEIKHYHSSALMKLWGKIYSNIEIDENKGIEEIKKIKPFSYTQLVNFFKSKLSDKQRDKVIKTVAKIIYNHHITYMNDESSLYTTVKNNKLVEGVIEKNKALLKNLNPDERLFADFFFTTIGTRLFTQKNKVGKLIFTENEILDLVKFSFALRNQISDLNVINRYKNIKSIYNKIVKFNGNKKNAEKKALNFLKYQLKFYDIDGFFDPFFFHYYVQDGTDGTRNTLKEFFSIYNYIYTNNRIVNLENNNGFDVILNSTIKYKKKLNEILEGNFVEGDNIANRESSIVFYSTFLPPFLVEKISKGAGELYVLAKKQIAKVLKVTNLDEQGSIRKFSKEYAKLIDLVGEDKAEKIMLDLRRRLAPPNKEITPDEMRIIAYEMNEIRKTYEKGKTFKWFERKSIPTETLSKKFPMFKKLYDNYTQEEGNIKAFASHVTEVINKIKDNPFSSKEYSRVLNEYNELINSINRQIMKIGYAKDEATKNKLKTELQEIIDEFNEFSKNNKEIIDDVKDFIDAYEKGLLGILDKNGGYKEITDEKYKKFNEDKYHAFAFHLKELSDLIYEHDLKNYEKFIAPYYDLLYDNLQARLDYLVESEVIKPTMRESILKEFERKYKDPPKKVEFYYPHYLNSFIVEILSVTENPYMGYHDWFYLSPIESFTKPVITGHFLNRSKNGGKGKDEVYGIKLPEDFVKGININITDIMEKRALLSNHIYLKNMRRALFRNLFMNLESAKPFLKTKKDYDNFVDYIYGLYFKLEGIGAFGRYADFVKALGNRNVLDYVDEGGFEEWKHNVYSNSQLMNLHALKLGEVKKLLNKIITSFGVGSMLSAPASALRQYSQMLNLVADPDLSTRKDLLKKYTDVKANVVSIDGYIDIKGKERNIFNDLGIELDDILSTAETGKELTLKDVMDKEVYYKDLKYLRMAANAMQKFASAGTQKAFYIFNLPEPVAKFFVFNKAENTTRQLAARYIFSIEFRRLKSVGYDEEKAYDLAIDYTRRKVNDLFFNYSMMNRPEVLRKNNSFMFLFWSYTLFTTNMVSKWARFGGVKSLKALTIAGMLQLAYALLYKFMYVDLFSFHPMDRLFELGKDIFDIMRAGYYYSVGKEDDAKDLMEKISRGKGIAGFLSQFFVVGGDGIVYLTDFAYRLAEQAFMKNEPSPSENGIVFKDTGILTDSQREAFEKGLKGKYIPRPLKFFLDLEKNYSNVRAAYKFDPILFRDIRNEELIRLWSNLSRYTLGFGYRYWEDDDYISEGAAKRVLDKERVGKMKKSIRQDIKR